MAGVRGRMRVTAEVSGVGHQHGFLRVGDSLEFRICLEWTGRRCFWSEWPLASRLGRDVRQVLVDRLEKAESREGFLEELCSLVERAFGGTMAPGVDDAAMVEFHLEVVREMERWDGWRRLCSMDKTLTEMVFRCVDTSGREHDLGMQWQFQVSNAGYSFFPRVSAKLPDVAALQEFVVEHRERKGKSGEMLDLQRFYQIFQEQVEQMQLFWDAMEDIDSNCWVLEPELGNRVSTMRRIVIAKHCSMQIEFEPKQVMAVPCVCRFFGPQEFTDQLALKFQRRKNLWNQALTPRQNLECILDIQFPKKAQESKEDYGMECGICYSFNLETNAPDKSCENPKCNRQFHQRCVYEWLKSLPTSRSSFDAVFGNCPYCLGPMSARLSQE